MLVLSITATITASDLELCHIFIEAKQMHAKKIYETAHLFWYTREALLEICNLAI